MGDILAQNGQIGDSYRQTSSWNLYLSILLHYFSYNNSITVTMQLNALHACSLFFFTACFGLSRPSSGIISYAKTVRLYWMPFLFLVLLSTSHTVVPLYWHSLRLFCIKCFVFKILSLKWLLFLFLKLFYFKDEILKTKHFIQNNLSEC
jgi:hypothetical protein